MCDEFGFLFRLLNHYLMAPLQYAYERTVTEIVFAAATAAAAASAAASAAAAAAAADAADADDAADAAAAL